MVRCLTLLSNAAIAISFLRQIGVDQSREEGVIAKLGLGCGHASNQIDTDAVLHWQAPELLSKSSQPTTKSDVYSFGILLWELLARSVPFGEFLDLAPFLDELQEAIVQGLRPTIPQRAPFDYARLIEDCWYELMLFRAFLPRSASLCTVHCPIPC